MKVPLLKFVGSSGFPLLNFEEGPGVPLLNFRVFPGPTFKLWGGSRGPRSRGPGPTFTPCPKVNFKISYNVRNTSWHWFAAVFGRHEFSVVSRSLFIRDGKLHKSSDKSVILNETENSTNQSQDALFHSSLFPNERDSVITFDCMAIVNSTIIENLKNFKTCEDFANAFANQIIVDLQGFPELRVILDIYLDISLKWKTGNNRTNGIQI